MEDSRIVIGGYEVTRLAEEALGRGRRDEEALTALMAAVEARVQSVLSRSRPDGEARPACSHGCATCCTVNVGTLAVEGAAAAAWLGKRTGSGEVGRRAADRCCASTGTPGGWRTPSDPFRCALPVR